MQYCLLSTVPLTLADSEIVVSDYYDQGKLGMYLVAYKDTGELDPNYDYYSLRVCLADLTYRNIWEIGPVSAHIRLAILNSAIEPPGSHKPGAGFVFSSPNSVTFGFEGIGYNMQIPGYWVSYDTSDDDTWHYVDWQVDSGDSGLGFWFLFDDYSEFTVGLRVPEGYTVEAYAEGWIVWDQFMLYIMVPYDYDEYQWLHVVYNPEGFRMNNIGEQVPPPTPFEGPNFSTLEPYRLSPNLTAPYGTGVNASTDSVQIIK